MEGVKYRRETRKRKWKTVLYEMECVIRFKKRIHGNCYGQRGVEEHSIVELLKKKKHL